MSKHQQNDDLDDMIAKFTHEVTERAMLRAKSVHDSGGFDIDAHCINMMTSEPFLAAICRRITKMPGDKLPTAGIASDGERIMMLFNPEFMRGLTDPHVQGVIKHELYHLILMHLTTRMRELKQVWNIATDLAINSLLGRNALPEFVLYPGEHLKVTDEVKAAWTPEQLKQNEALSDLIASFPVLQTSDWYYSKLLQDPNVQQMTAGGIKIVVDSSGQGQMQPGSGMPQFDSHDFWDTVPEETKDMIRERVRQIVKDAVSQADSKTNGWGSVPSEMRDEIRKMVSNQVDWKTLLRTFVGFSQRADREHTRQRRHRKYGLVHPGTRRGHMAHILVAIDQSGSVSNESLEFLYAELDALSRFATFTILPFDSEVDEKNIIVWRRGQHLEARRTRCGGTDFNAPTQWFNAHHEYDGLLVLTDGECSAPGPCRSRRAWLLPPQCKMYFETNELVMIMETHGASKD